MIRAALLIGVLAAGCGATRNAYVVALEVDGRELVVHKCNVVRTQDRIDEGSCFEERLDIPAPTEPGAKAVTQ